MLRFWTIRHDHNEIFIAYRELSGSRFYWSRNESQGPGGRGHHAGRIAIDAGGVMSGKVIEFPIERAWDKGAERTSIDDGITPGQKLAILNAIMQRAGQHVRLAAIVKRTSALVDDKLAQQIAIRVSHYILSGQELP